MVSGNLFYASDKAICDALTQHKFTNADLKELFLSRGIIVSSQTDRDDLARYFSRLSHDYFDHQNIAKIFGGGPRREKSSVTNIGNKISIDLIEQAAKIICDSQNTIGDIAGCTTYQKRIDIKIQYTEVDYNKTEFRQVSEREAVISVEVNDDGVTIRWPLNDYIEDIKEKLLDELTKQIGGDEKLDVKELSLESVLSPTQRTAFFFDLMKSMEGFTLIDVTDAYVYHPKTLLKEEDGDKSGDLGVHVSKASLKGEGVLESEELQSLFHKGFYIWRVIWVAKTSSHDADLTEFEAQFSDAEACKKFSYMVRGVYKYRDGSYNKGRTSLADLEERKLSRLIEIAAVTAIKKCEAHLVDSLNSSNVPETSDAA